MSHLIHKGLEPFSVFGYHRGESRLYTMDDLLGHWSVLFFYPADFTFVCPTELKELGEHYDGFWQKTARFSPSARIRTLFTRHGRTHRKPSAICPM